MKNIIRMSIPSSLENLSLIRALVKTYLEVQHINEKDIFQLLSVVDELSTNVVEHGYKYKPGDIILEIQKEGLFILCVKGHCIASLKNRKLRNILAFYLLSKVTI